MTVISKTGRLRAGIFLLLMLVLALAACGGGGGGSSSGNGSGASSSSSGGNTSLCGSSSSSSSSSSSGSGSSSSGANILQGMVMSGSEAVSGAAITAYAAANNSCAAPQQIGTGTSDSAGNFSLTFDTAPANGQLVYAIASGGNAGQGSNTDIGLMSVAGRFCTGSSCSFPASITLNEFSTAASVTALQQFLTREPCTNIGGNTRDGKCTEVLGGPGLGNADLVLSQQLASNGTAGPLLANACASSGNNCTALQKLNTLANILHACTASSGTGSLPCQALQQATGTSSDTLAAMLAIASESILRSQGPALWALASSSAFSPALSAAPGDWTIALSYANAGLTQPAGVAVDGNGDIWIADNTGTGDIVKLAADGTLLSPAGGFTGGGLAGPQGLAIDQGGNVWVANWRQGDGTTITELSSAGALLTGSTGITGGGIFGPYDVAVGPDGIVRVANYGNSSLTSISAGQPTGPIELNQLAFPTTLAIDNNNDVWIASNSGHSIYEFGPGNNLISSPAYDSAQLGSPFGIALDTRGNAWVSDFYADGLGEVFGGNTPVACPATAITGDTGCPVSSALFTGGGLSGPSDIAIDSANQVWVVNYHGTALSVFGENGQPLSSSGYEGAGVQAVGLAIDAAGNIWITDAGGNTVNVFIGLASPVKTPLIGLPSPP